MGLSIKVANLSSLAWERNNWQVGAGKSEKVSVYDEVTQVPAETLAAHDGGADAEASSEHLSWLAQDALWMTLGYGSSDGNFGVSIQQLFHMLGAGRQCQWQVWDGSDWGKWTSDASPYQWTFKQTTVSAVPALSDSGASVNIVITNV